MEFYNNIYQNVLDNKNFKRYSRITYLGALFAERFNKSIGNLRKPVFERSDANWINVLPTITEQYNNQVHTSNKLTPMQGSSKKNEANVFKKIITKRKTIKPKCQVNDLVRTADLKKTFSKSDPTNLSYTL